MKAPKIHSYFLCCCLLAACSVSKNVSIPSQQSLDNWTVEALIMPGADPISFYLISGSQPPPATPLFYFKEPKAIVYHALSYQRAQRIREQLAATGLVEQLKVYRE